MRKICKVIHVLILACLLLRNIPLNAFAEDVEFYMEVGEVGRKSETCSVGQQHHWFMRIKLTSDWSGITILQTLSPVLTLDASTVNMKILRENNEQILMRMGDHFQLTAGSVFVEGGVSDRVCITLTAEGMEFLSEYMTQDSQLLVSYAASINTNASMGTQILGTAQLTLTDPDGKRYIFLSDKAAAATGGFHFRLTNQEGKPVRNREFMLARKAEEGEIDDPEIVKEVLDTGSETIAVVFERFYTSEAMDGKSCDTVFTNKNGEALCYGLAYGTYYLVQTEKGQETTLPLNPIEIKINESSHITSEDGWTDSQGKNADNTVTIVQNEVRMPNTGGPGTAPFTVSGTMVILCACLLLWYNRKQTSLL